MTKGHRDKRTVSSALTVDTTMADLIDRWPASRIVLARRGMACVGCTMAPFETIAEVAEAYGFDAADFLRDIVAQVPAPPRVERLRRRKDRQRGPGNDSR